MVFKSYTEDRKHLEERLWQVAHEQVLVSSSPLWFYEGWGGKLVTAEKTKRAGWKRDTQRDWLAKKGSSLPSSRQDPRALPWERSTRREKGNEMLSWGRRSRTMGPDEERNPHFWSRKAGLSNTSNFREPWGLRRDNAIKPAGNSGRMAMQESQKEAHENLDCKDFYEFGYRPQKTFEKKKKTTPLWGWMKSQQHIRRLRPAHQYKVAINGSVHRELWKMYDRPMTRYWFRTADSQIRLLGYKTWLCHSLAGRTWVSFSTSLSHSFPAYRMEMGIV